MYEIHTQLISLTLFSLNFQILSASQCNLKEPLDMEMKLDFFIDDPSECLIHALIDIKLISVNQVFPSRIRSLLPLLVSCFLAIKYCRYVWILMGPFGCHE